MKITKKLLMSVLLAGVMILIMSFDLPKGWYAAGNKPESYKMGIDKGAGQNGSNVATIQSIDKKIKGFGTLMQSCQPDKYLGKRVRMTGYIKSEDIKEWAGFWFRVDGTSSQQSLSFDNMHDGKKDRSIKGTTVWTKYEIVLDVPLKATNLAYGALVSGTGKIWFDDIKFEIVDNSVPTTGMEADHSMPGNEPNNLDFDK